MYSCVLDTDWEEGVTNAVADAASVNAMLAAIFPIFIVVIYMLLSEYYMLQSFEAIYLLLVCFKEEESIFNSG